MNFKLTCNVLLLLLPEIFCVCNSILTSIQTTKINQKSLSKLHCRNSVHYSCPCFRYPVYRMCIEHKDCIYNCWEIKVWSLLLPFKCCKMLLEDKGDETQPCGCKYPTPTCALAKYYPRWLWAPSFVKSISPITNINKFLTFSTSILCPCMYAPEDS